VPGLAFDRSGRRLASAGHDGVVRIWDLATGRELASHQEHGGKVECVAWNPAGDRVASGGQDKRVIVWKPGGEPQVKVLARTTGAVATVAFSADGLGVIVANHNATVHSWDLVTGKPASHLEPWAVATAVGLGLASADAVPAVATPAGLLGVPGPQRSDFRTGVPQISWVMLSEDGRQLAVGGGSGPTYTQGGLPGERLAAMQF
jgi:hypothetical protein